MQAVVRPRHANYIMRDQVRDLVPNLIQDSYYATTKRRNPTFALVTFAVATLSYLGAAILSIV